LRTRSLVTLRKPRSRRLGSGFYVVGAYVAVAILVMAAVVGVKGAIPWAHPTPSWALSPLAAMGWSVVASGAIALVVIAFSRLASRRFDWAQRLADRFRPAASSFSSAEIVAIAIASSVAEELLFRAVLVPWLGVLPAALLFGLAHQMKGRSRFAWIAFSFAVGAGLGAIYEATGSLVGPIVAHAAINALNLAWLKAGDSSTRREALPSLA
jgi:membrane protease YdiL (CAAX protease family)